MQKAVEALEMSPQVFLCSLQRLDHWASRGRRATVSKGSLKSTSSSSRTSHVRQMMAALEQFLIDENWTVASRLTGTEEPPWGHWAVQDLGSLAVRLHAPGRGYVDMGLDKQAQGGGMAVQEKSH